MTRLISITSGKGGVGKTTLTANLGSALVEHGMDTVVLDTNLTNPNLGFHLGIPLYPKTLHDVLRGDTHISEAMYIHNSGLRVVPAGLSVEDLKNTTPERLNEVLLHLIGDPDTVLVDAAAGLGKEALAALEATDETIIVTNPDLPSVTDALKTAAVAEDIGTRVYGVVLNRVRRQPVELTVDEVESMVGHPVVAVVPEDDKFRESVAIKSPLVHYAPERPAAHEIRRLAAELAGVDYEPSRMDQRGVIQRILDFLS